MALEVTNSSQMQSKTTGTSGLQQTSSQGLAAPAQPTTATTPEDQDRLLSLLKANADGPSSDTRTGGGGDRFAMSLIIVVVAAAALILLFIYQRLALKLLNR